MIIYWTYEIVFLDRRKLSDRDEPSTTRCEISTKQQSQIPDTVPHRLSYDSPSLFQADNPFQGENVRPGTLGVATQPQARKKTPWSCDTESALWL
jgi:hypothetical protein